VPLSADSRPAMILSSVDLPMPDSPMIATNSARATSNETSRSTRRGRGPGYVFEGLETEITAGERTTTHAADRLASRYAACGTLASGDQMSRTTVINASTAG